MGGAGDSKFSLTSKINEVDFNFSLTNNESKKKTLIQRHTPQIEELKVMNTYYFTRLNQKLKFRPKKEITASYGPFTLKRLLYSRERSLIDR